MKLTDDDRDIQLNHYNNSKNSFPNTKTLVELFENQVLSTPENVALVYDQISFSYEELNVLSGELAGYLQAQQEIKPGDFVGILLERSEWWIVGILAILKTGATYVPLDISSPKKRTSFITENAGCKAVFDTKMIDDFLAQRKVSGLKEFVKPNTSPDDVAYAIYTSGTTGKPKGVIVSHKSVANLITYQTSYFGIDQYENILQFSNCFFDASVEQIFLALLNGAKLTMVSKSVLENHALESFLIKNSITHLHATPSYLETLSDLSSVSFLKRIIAGGETCTVDLAKKFGENFNFYNEYGPTETTITSTVYQFSKNDDTKKVLPIGKPIGNTKVYVLSEEFELLPHGEVGELFIAGVGVAKGYLKLEGLTNEKFVDNPFDSVGKMYRTGDLVKWLPDGNLEFIGRKDDQVKIRGYRIELGEVENALNSLTQVKRAVVVATDGPEAKLIGYVQSDNDIKDIGQLKELLSQSLPSYMIPSNYVWVSEFPLNANGKVDKKNLPKPVYERPPSAPALRKPQNKLQKQIAKIWSAYLEIPVGIDDNFFEMGGSSLMTQKVAVKITNLIGKKVAATKIYQFPTIAQLTDFLEPKENSKPNESTLKTSNRGNSKSIAVVGMALRFPGADNPERFWEVLSNGEETISFFKPEELDASIPESLRKDPLYVGARGIVPSAKTFDPLFFGLTPKIAEAMDPQHRLFMEISWEVLEKTGYLPKHYNGSIGVYAGSGTNSYYANNILPNQEVLQRVGPFQATTLNDKDYIASRTSYHLNLKGPSVSVHSACSTSLLAIAEAVEAIRSGQCDMAIAGGSSITAPMNSGHLYQEGSMLSSDGHCRSFDAEGKGTVFSDGAGVVLLKNLEAAERDGDVIYGLVKGIGVNNDGGNKGSFTAPSVEGQSNAIMMAMNDAEIRPDSISYIEAHGTATPLGDPIEMEGLNRAFGKQRNSYCAIGSVKSNMGHMTAAAGVAGFVKTILALNHKTIPPSLGFTNPNPSIDFENSPFYVNNTLKDWDVEGTRSAGISSFGVGGTNVHVVVEEYLRDKKVESSTSKRPYQLLTWSAKTENSLIGYQEKLQDYVAGNSKVSLSDIAYSLKNTRMDFSHRSILIAEDSKKALDDLKGIEPVKIKSKYLKEVPSEIAFMFPGQGAQFLQMGKSLYEHETVYRKAVDECAELLTNFIEEDIRSIIFSDTDTVETREKLKNTKYAQPALFVTEYALAKLWKSWGIQPTVVCGHSIGEFVAAHMAGVFTLQDALRLIAVRGQMVSQLPEGSMLSVRLSVSELKEILPDSLSIAAINSTKLCVVSGEDKEVDDFSVKLKSQGVANRKLATSHAFHSHMMAPILETFKKEVEKVALNAPSLPIISTVTGARATDAELTSAEYWTNHLRDTVRFSDALETITKLDAPLLLEVGPGQTLITLAKQSKEGRALTALSSLPVPKDNLDSYKNTLNTLGELWLNGLEPDWEAFYIEEVRKKVTLPSYAFDRKPCWIAPVQTNIVKNQVQIEKEVIPQIEEIPINSEIAMGEKPSRKTAILNKISDIILNASGIELESGDHEHTFLELGLDSLVLTQMAITIKNEFDTPITFRQLNGEFSSPDLLAKHLDEVLPEDKMQPTSNVSSAATTTQVTSASSTLQHLNGEGQNQALNLIAQQLQLLGKQVELLQGNAVPKMNTNTVSNTLVANKPSVKEVSNELTEEEKKEHKKPFGASPKIQQQVSKIDEAHKEFLKKVTERYNKKTKGSKAYTQKHRKQMSDPRVVTGFKPVTKELVYPLVIKKSSGNRLWDVDGNEYIDALNGFGSCLFGHQPDFIKEALHYQVEQGFEVGPQHPLAGEVCELLCEFTGHDRSALCNTGSEAVLGAMRIARTVTGRSLIVAFSKSYHGINDEVIVRGSKKMKTFPAAPGILSDAVQNMLILEYGSPESLEIIKNRANELAAVLVEPIQSRRPELQPVDFLKEVRKITEASKTVLIFDEIITGFRMHPGGTQALFGIKADLATYGKVIGGGISIGAIAGKGEYMDALDGGYWSFGDDSVPEVGVTYFAGTFVRHPLALASTKASLNHMKERGGQLQERLNKMTEDLALEMNIEFRKRKLPMEINYFGSLWRLNFKKEVPYSELLFVLMREKGIHIWDGFPCYMTDAYIDEDIARIKNAMSESIEELIAIGILPSESGNNSLNSENAVDTFKQINTPPVQGAKLGIDDKGNPAWFVSNPKEKGDYIKIDV